MVTEEKNVDLIACQFLTSPPINAIQFAGSPHSLLGTALMYSLCLSELLAWSMVLSLQS